MPVLYEPVTGAFRTPYASAANKAIAENGLILLTEVGSTLHGVSSDVTADDVDEMGICIEPPSQVIGLDGFEQYEYRTQPVNVRSGAGDIDRTIYGLRKWTRLAAAGNPTLLMPLFSDEQLHLRYLNEVGRELRSRADLFLSKLVGRKFRGYLDGQRKRYLDPARQDSKHASRPELIAAYGWDTKSGYHALRLAIQGTEVMETGRIALPMSAVNRELLLDVRQGKYTKLDVTDMISAQEVLLARATESSDLPDRPDMPKVNAWLVDTYQSWWRH